MKPLITSAAPRTFEHPERFMLLTPTNDFRTKNYLFRNLKNIFRSYQSYILSNPFSSARTSQKYYVQFLSSPYLSRVYAGIAARRMMPRLSMPLPSHPRYYPPASRYFFAMAQVVVRSSRNPSPPLHVSHWLSVSDIWDRCSVCLLYQSCVTDRGWRSKSSRKDASLAPFPLYGSNGTDSSALFKRIAYIFLFLFVGLDYCNTVK